MIGYIRDLRLIPIALIASACLLALKIADIGLHSASWFDRDSAVASDNDVSVIRPMPDATAPPGTKLSWAQQMFNFPNSSGTPASPREMPHPPRRLAAADDVDITGTVPTTPVGPESKGTPLASLGPAGNASLPPGGVVIAKDGTAVPTGAERAILERLQARREELDSRSRELDIRESLIQGEEKRIDARLGELKDIEAKIKEETQQKDDAATARLKGLITMYENMKARDAAKIFDRLETGVLMQVAAQINPRQMADILAQMSPDVAERLTVELAANAQAKPSGDAALPKIEGQPTP
jgi:flagellar motility protein MotE (MotC chaperone)